MNLDTTLGAPTARDQQLCLTIAAGLHLLLFIWNPTLLRTLWQQAPKFLTIETNVDWPEPPAIKPTLPTASPMSRMPAVHRPLSVAPRTYHTWSAPMVHPTAETPLLGETMAPIALDNKTQPVAIPIGRPALTDAHRFQIKGPVIADRQRLGDLDGVPHSSIAESPTLESGGAHSSSAAKIPIEGTAGDLKVLRRVVPPYPSWAEEQGITGSVRLHFTVAADGSVRNDIRVVKTTGNSDLDKLAIDAMRAWKFAPLGDSASPAPWGIITFNFSLAS